MQSATRSILCLSKATRMFSKLQRCSCPASWRFISSSQTCYTDTIAPPHQEGTEKEYAPKIRQIVDDISKLTLIEVADLNELLKKTLNITDTPMMMGAMPAMAAAPKEEEEEAPAKQEKMSFTVKLVKFDAGQKVAIIKEIKNLMSGMNLVQSKKFIESCPQPVKTDVTKEEAEKIKAALEAVGGSVEIE